MNLAKSEDIAVRPIAVIGRGTLGRRIALMASTRGGEVRIFDTQERSLEQGLNFVTETLPAIVHRLQGLPPGAYGAKQTSPLQ